MNLDCFDNNDIRRMTTMKKYPYTESTDLIIYDQKPKKEKKQKVWLTAVCSALAKEYEQQHSKRGSCKCNNTIG